MSEARIGCHGGDGFFTGVQNDKDELLPPGTTVVDDRQGPVAGGRILRIAQPDKRKAPIFFVILNASEESVPFQAVPAQEYPHHAYVLAYETGLNTVLITQLR